MTEIEKEAKTAEEAIEAALTELGVTREAVEIKVLEEGKNGLFGLAGAKKVKVRVTLKKA